MGRPSLIEEHNLGALIVALREGGTTRAGPIAQEVENQTGIRIHRNTVQRWLDGKTGSIALAARRAKPPAKVNGKPAPLSKAEPVEMDEGDSLDDRLCRAMLAVVEDPATPLTERRLWAEQLIYHRHLVRHGEPP